MDQEKYIIELYPQGFSYEINNFIREGFECKPYEGEDENERMEARREYFSQFCKDSNEINKCLMYYYQKLQNIILNAPKTEERLIVYRGIRTIEFFKTEEPTHKNVGIMSTSLDFNIAQSAEFTKGYVLKIVVPKGFSCLFIGSLNTIIG